ncbi:hypothetical protein PCC9214_00219 [Planktothrix tepida]|uniref:Uncharacterized protein n=3 Tax=Microcoleaceae TaxID=1892252 RepID=A0A1J1LG20_9CYAN|nr:MULTISPECIES: hypothetical protein [Planktothrix]CAD5913881.1 hypothetical protein PCC9214_00219 [Planktothrix tepida]CAD5986316.1 hypothetical protein NO713_05598 [Planktothrix pseudagardhii]CUR30521.1 conserved hypothetical protein [Planktothrix tepida PCC 9214]
MKGEKPVKLEMGYSTTSNHQGVSAYVADLQLHMTLQARNLVPNLTQARDSREQMLQQTQADLEKYISRQTL